MSSPAMDVFSGELKSCSNTLFQPDSCLAPFPQTPYPVFTDPPQPQKLRPIRRNSDDPTDTDIAPQEPCLLNEVGCETSSSYISSVSKAFQEYKAETDAHILQLISQGRSLEPDFSSSSDDDSESSEAIKEPTNRKRKRTRKSLELLMENIMRKVMYNQEQMHRHLLEILEKNEEARLIREEAWKQQEIERARKNEESRIEEASRSLALISYIQDLLGHEIQIPKLSCEVSCPEQNEQEFIDLGSCDNDDPSNRGWRKSEVQSLITVRAALDHKFLNGHKGSLWELVAARLFKMGYNRTAKNCKEKWENINNYYRKTLESEKSCPGYTKSCPYFQELDIIYKSGLITSVNATNTI